MAICAQRSVEQLISVLAVLKSGAAYVPVDPAYPPERIEFMLADSRARAVLTDDGQLQNRIASPRNKMEKTYLVQVEGAPTGRDLDPLRRGVTLKDGPTRPARVRPKSGTVIPPCAPAKPCRTDGSKSPSPKAATVRFAG